jgi:hypothetical protein
MTDLDGKLMELLGPPDRDADRAFVNMIGQHVLLEQRLRRARLLAWRNFWKEVTVSGIVLAVLLVIVAVGKSGVGGGMDLPVSPATLALFIFSIWAAAALQPAAGSNLK